MRPDPPAREKPPTSGKTLDSIENRRKVFKEPEVIDWKEQRKITLDQSKSILGH